MADLVCIRGEVCENMQNAFNVIEKIREIVGYREFGANPDFIVEQISDLLAVGNSIQDKIIDELKS